MSELAPISDRFRDAFGKPSQIAGIWSAMLENLQRRSASKSLPPPDYELLLEHAKDVLAEIHVSIRGDGFDSSGLKEPGRIWVKAHSRMGFSRWSQQEIMERYNFVGQSTSMEPDSNRLEWAIARYLAMPDAQTDWLDWILIDHILFAELVAFNDEIVTSNDNMVPDFSLQAALFAGKSLSELSGIRLRMRLLRGSFGLVAGLAMFSGWLAILYSLLKFRYDVAVILNAPTDYIWVLVGVVAMCGAVPLASWLWGGFLPSTRKYESVTLLREMNRLYQLWQWPTVCPGYFQSELKRVTDRGAVYWPSLHVLLGQIVSRNPLLFGPLGVGSR